MVHKTPDHYNHREVAAILGIHPDYVHDLAMQGKLPHVKMAKGIAGRYDMRFPKAEIDKIAASNVETVANKRSEGFRIGKEEHIQETEPDEPEWFNCNKCKSVVHKTDLNAHAQAHSYDEKDN
jgi:hypothetical protein